MKIRLFKYFLCNIKMYFMRMCILTREMFCLHRSSLSSFHHNTHMFEPFLILYKFLFFLFHFHITNIALWLCYLVVTSRLTRRFVTSRDQVSSFKMAFSRVQVGTTHLSQYRIQLTVEISASASSASPSVTCACDSRIRKLMIVCVRYKTGRATKLLGHYLSGSN